MRRPSKHKSSTGLGGKETPLLEGAHKVSCAPGTREKAVISKGPGSDIPVGLGGSPGKVRGGCGLLGTRTLVAEVLGSTHWHELSWRPPF